LFQIFFYFSGLILLLVLNGVPIFQQSVDSELYEWLLKEQKRRKARSIQDVIRQVLREAKVEAERHHG
jgi:predicted nucleotidyltransferase